MTLEVPVSLAVQQRAQKYYEQVKEQTMLGFIIIRAEGFGCQVKRQV